MPNDWDNQSFETPIPEVLVHTSPNFMHCQTPVKAHARMRSGAHVSSHFFCAQIH